MATRKQTASPNRLIIVAKMRIYFFLSWDGYELFFTGDSQLVRDESKAQSEAKCWMKEAALCSVGWAPETEQFPCFIVVASHRGLHIGTRGRGSSYPHPHKTQAEHPVCSSLLSIPRGFRSNIERSESRSVPVGKLVTCYHYCGVSCVTWRDICHDNVTRETRTLRCLGNGNTSETARNTRLSDDGESLVLMKREILTQTSQTVISDA